MSEKPRPFHITEILMAYTGLQFPLPVGVADPTGEHHLEHDSPFAIIQTISSVALDTSLLTHEVPDVSDQVTLRLETQFPFLKQVALRDIDGFKSTEKYIAYLANFAADLGEKHGFWFDVKSARTIDLTAEKAIRRFEPTQ